MNSKEYMLLIKASLEIMPLIRDKVSIYDELLFIQECDVLSTIIDKANKEFNNYKIYPNYDLSKFYELVLSANEYETAIKITWKVSKDINKENWQTFRHNKQLARFMYEDVDITKIIDLSQNS